MKTIGFFEETPGSKSMNRLITFVWSMFAVLMAAWVFLATKDYSATIAVFTSISAIAAGTKLIQKNMEAKPEIKTDEQAQ